MDLGAKVLRVLQIGDVHFPDGHNSAPNADAKDDGITTGFVGSIASNSFRSSVRGLLSLLEDEDVNFVTLMGDLTSKGDLGGYRNCLEFLADGLRLTDEPLVASNKILFVAGNHDVCRQTAIDTPERKFTVLNDMLEECGFHRLSVNEVDHRPVESDNGILHILGINSCVGCGEKRFLPSRIQDAIYEKLNADLADDDIDNQEVLHDIYEQIDAPAIATSTIQDLVRKVGNLDPKSLGMIVAHHNLLPQSSPRIDPYTELLNSGSLRETVSQFGRPMLYLHGHIHTDPIEIITSPISGNHPLICVSAPAFQDGFNVLEIAFASDATPIGCKVIPYRANTSGYVQKRKHTIIPFGGIPTRILDGEASTLASVILQRQLMTWDDFLSDEGVEQLELDSETLKDRTIELYWHGLIEIENMDNVPSDWRIRSLMG